MSKNAGRRGIGIELALLVLVVVAGLSTLLVSTAMLEKNDLQKDKAALSQRMELDKLAEEFCKAPVAGWESPNTDYQAWAYSADNHLILELMLITGEGENAVVSEPLLTVVLEESGEAYKVVQWTHH